jgi:hypothetical protein
MCDREDGLNPALAASLKSHRHCRGPVQVLLSRPLP